MNIYNLKTADFEGKNPFYLFPYEINESNWEPTWKKIKEFLDSNPVYLEFTQGSRKGTIARLDYSNLELFYTLYQHRRIYFRNHNLIATVSCNGRKFTSDFSRNYPIIRFGVTEVWSFITNKKTDAEKLPMVMYDHFNVQLKVGQNIIYPDSLNGSIYLLFGEITEITPKGSIRIKQIRTRKDYPSETKILSYKIASSDLIVLDDQSIRDKFLIAKLKN